MDNTLQGYLKAQDWVAAEALLRAKIRESENALAATLLLARVLRAQNRGEEANVLLANTLATPSRAPLPQWSELAEELIQCGLWAEANKVIDQIQAAEPLQGRFLKLLLLRELEDWPNFDLAYAALRTAPPPFPALAEVQSAWADLRRGFIKRAEQKLAYFATETNAALRKVHARVAIAAGRLDAARALVDALRREQPLDWESLALEGLCYPERARACFDLSLQRQPRQADTLTNRAALLVQQGDLERAQDDCQAALAIKPWYDPPVLLWTQVLWRQKRRQEALAFLERAISHHPTPSRVAAHLDLMRELGGRAKTLKETALKALQQYPEAPPVLLSAGALLQVVHALDRAEECYRRSLDLRPEDHAARNNLAQLLLERGEVAEAIELWREIEPQNEIVRLNYAQALQKRGDTLEAEAIYRAVLAQSPHHPIALRGLADILASAGDYDAALPLAEQALARAPEHPRSWLLLAALYQQLGRNDRAIDLLLHGAQRVIRPLALHQALFNAWRRTDAEATALAYLQQWQKTWPQEPEYLLMQADIFYDHNDFASAEKAIRDAMQIEWPTGAAALVRFFQRRGRYEEALQQAEALLRHDPSVMRHYGLLSEILYRQERYAEALAVLDKALAQQPHRLALVRQKVGQLLAQERFDEAIATGHRLVMDKPSPPHIALLLEAYRRAHDFADAVRLCRELVERDPTNLQWQLQLASNLAYNQQPEEALAVLEAAWKKEPKNLEVANRLIRQLIALERYPQALAVVRQIKEHVGDRPDNISILATILRDMGERAEALDLLRTSVARFPNHLGLHQMLADLLYFNQRRDEELQLIEAMLIRFPPEHVLGWAIPRLVRLKAEKVAVAALDRWQEANPQDTRPLWARFALAKEVQRLDTALKILSVIEARKPAGVRLLTARAALLSDLWRMSEAIDEQKKAVALCPDDPAPLSELLNLLVKAGDFDSFNAIWQQLNRLWGDSRYTHYHNFFFNLNCHPTLSAAEIFCFYRDWYEKGVRPHKPAPRPHKNPPDPERRLRIGYVSPDFRRHAVAYFSEPLLMAHDREQFELFAYAHLEPGQTDAYTERFRSYVHHWVETRGMSDAELERRVRDDGIDILVDLAGHTANNRLSLFVRRPAPVQASWIFGAGQTTGLAEVDYLLCDAVTVPPEHEPFITEKVLRLPFAGLPYKPGADFLDPSPLPCLSAPQVVLGVLSRPLRTNRHTVRVWAQILAAVPEAILRFDHVPYAEAEIQERLRCQFAEHGIGAERLEFRNTRPHWQALREIDVQLDCFPAGSGTVVSDGLWMERLAVTLRSRPPMGLSATAQLTALGLTEPCVAASEEEYVAKAVALIRNRQRLAALSHGLRARMQCSPLMDYAAYGREAAKLYRQMWRTYCEKQRTAC